MADIKAVIDLYEHNSRLIDRQRGKLSILPLLYLMEGEKQKGVGGVIRSSFRFNYWDPASGTLSSTSSFLSFRGFTF